MVLNVEVVLREELSAATPAAVGRHHQQATWTS